MHTSHDKEYPNHQDAQRFPYLWAVTRKVSVSSCPDKWLVSKITLNSYCVKKKQYLETLYIVSKCIYFDTSHIFYWPSCTKVAYFDTCKRASSTVE